MLPLPAALLLAGQAVPAEVLVQAVELRCVWRSALAGAVVAGLLVQAACHSAVLAAQAAQAALRSLAAATLTPP